MIHAWHLTTSTFRWKLWEICAQESSARITMSVSTFLVMDSALRESAVWLRYAQTRSITVVRRFATIHLAMNIQVNIALRSVLVASAAGQINAQLTLMRQRRDARDLLVKKMNNALIIPKTETAHPIAWRGDAANKKNANLNQVTHSSVNSKIALHTLNAPRRTVNSGAFTVNAARRSCA